MSTQQERQVAISLRKFNLEEIVNHFTNNLLPAMPYLDEVMKQQLTKTMNALRAAQVQAAEISQLKQKLGQLQAKQARLNEECLELVALEQSTAARIDELLRLIREEEDKQAEYNRYYADEVQKIVNRNVEYAFIYDENVVTQKTELAEAQLSELLKEEEELKEKVAQLQKTLDELKPVVPENILEIMGKEELEETLKKLNKEVDAYRSF